MKHLFGELLLRWHDRNDPPMRSARRVRLPFGGGCVFYVEIVEVIDAIVVVDDRDACWHGNEHPIPAIIVIIRIDLRQARWSVVAVGLVFRRRLRLRRFFQPRRVAALLDGRVRTVHHRLLLAIVNQCALHSFYLGAQIVVVHDWTIIM